MSRSLTEPRGAEATARKRPPPGGRAFGLPADHQRFLAAIVESAEDGIFAKSLEGRILSWNAAAERMYGYTPDEIVGEFVFRLAPPDRHPEIESIIARIRSGGRIEHFETVRVRKNGELFPVSLAISPVRDARGTIVGASTIARDITEGRRMSESLSFQRSLLVAQAEASLDGILVVDTTGEVIFRNQRYVEMWADADTSNRSIESNSFALPIDGLSGDSLVTSRDQIGLPDGRVFDRFSAPVLGPDGRHYGRVWYFRDVTAETTTNARLRAVISAIDDGAFVCGADGRILLRNRAGGELIPGADTEAELLAALGATIEVEGAAGDGAASDSALDREYVLEVAGERRWVRLSRHPIRLDDPSETRPLADVGRIVLLRDVTELRDMQASREAFSGVLSHELRTPITTILGAAKMLTRVADDGSRDELLGDIAAEADRLYRLVEDLLVLTRIERASLSLADEPVLVGRVIDRVVAAERGELRGQHFEVVVERDLPIARGDDTYVEQIVRNLVGNALKYGPPDGIVRIVAHRAPGRVVVRVQDDGPGIDPNEVDRVFELLYRSPATAAQASGSGVGLFVSRRLAEAMGGRVGAAQRDGIGAEFVVELPAYDDEAGPHEEVDPEPAPVEDARPQRRRDSSPEGRAAGRA